ncbi:MAG: hypothetical protein RI580_03665 [Halothece sp. Uz-M2-17]|nr:hypothetical protein [Halothece sp. Uz-M2-17]
MATSRPNIVSIQKKNSQDTDTLEISDLKKEEIIDYLFAEIGGRRSYYRALKKEGLKVILELIRENPDGKEALTKLVAQQAAQADTNRRLGGQVSGLNHRVASRDRTIKNLMQHINTLKLQINEASHAINASLEHLTQLEKSEIIIGVKQIQDWLSKNFTNKV